MTRLGSRFQDMLLSLGRQVFDEPPPVGSPSFGLPGARLADWLPYREWDATKMLFVQKDTVGTIIEVTAPFTGFDAVQSRSLEQLMAGAVPVGAHAQFHCFLSPQIGFITDHWAQRRASQGEMYRKLALHRREHFRRAAWTSACGEIAPYYMRDIRVFISLEMPGAVNAHAADLLVEARDKFIADFKAMRSGAEVMTPADLIALVTDILNPTLSIQPTAPAYEDDRWISEQIVRGETTTTVYRDRLHVRARTPSDRLIYRSEGWTEEAEAIAQEEDGRDEDFIVRGFSIRKFPAFWTQGNMSRLLGDMFNDQVRLIGPTLMTLCFTPWTAEKSQSKAQLKKLRSDQQAKSPLSALQPEVRKAKEDWGYTLEDVSEGHNLGRLALFVVTISPMDQAQKAESRLRMVFRNCGFELQRDDDIHLQTLLACLPLTLGGGLGEDLDGRMGRFRTMPTSVAARLAPLQGEFLGYNEPHMLLTGRRGQVFYYSNFGNTHGNHNVAVIGASGSGKSVCMQDLTAGARGMGGLAFVIDDGRSFMNSCRLQGGNFIEFRADLKACVNPFPQINREEAARNDDYRGEKLEGIQVMLEQAARGRRGCTNEETGAISGAVGKVWETIGEAAGFQQVIDCLKADYGQRGADLALSLQPYGTDGIYGGFFNGPASLDVSNPYTVFEMSDLEKTPELRSVILIAILFIVRERMKVGGRDVRKVLVIDEAWQLFDDGPMSKFIEGFARRCRKEGGALITGTQSLNDYYRTAGSRACIENSDHVIILRQKEDSLEQLRNSDRIVVDEAKMQLLKSLKVVPDVYSEMVVQTPDGTFVGRLCLDRFSATLYSTTPKTWARIQQLTESGVPLPDAIEQIAAAA